MYYSITKKRQEFIDRIRNASRAIGSDILFRNGIELNRSDKVTRITWKLKGEAQTSVYQLSYVNLGKIERKVNEYIRLMDYTSKGVANLEDILLEFEKLTQKIDSEFHTLIAQMGRDRANAILKTFRNKKYNSIKRIKEQIHYIVDYSLGLKNIKFQEAKSIQQEYEKDVKDVLKVVEKEKQRAFEEEQKAKSLEMARLKEEEEKRLDLDRDKQILEAKRLLESHLQDKLTAYDTSVQRELDIYKRELALKFEKLDKKEAMIEQFLKEKQKEMYDNMVKQSDNIINDLAEQKAAEILKKLGIKL